MKLKKYLIILTILAAALTPAGSINGQYTEEGSEKYQKLSVIYSEMEQAFYRGQYNDVIKSADKLKDIGFTYNDLEEDEETENSDERAIWIDMLWFRGLAENNLGQYKEAGESFNFVLENAKNPSSHVFTFYAETLNKQGDRKKAISVLEKGVEYLEDKISDHDMHSLLWNLGWYYYLEKNYRKTIVLGFECSEISQYSTGPLFNASLAFLALKDDENAMRYFLKAFNSSFLYDDDFREWMFQAVIEDVNNFIKEYGGSDILNTMLFLAYKGLDDMASHIHSVYLMNEPLGRYTDFVDDPTPPFLYVIASSYSLKENSHVEKYLIQLRRSHPSYLERSKTDPDFDWYYSTHGDDKINKTNQRHIEKPKHKHIDKKKQKHIEKKKQKHTDKKKQKHTEKKKHKPVKKKKN